MELLRREENKLMQAIFTADWPAVRRICEHEQNLINTYDEYGHTPLMSAANRDESCRDVPVPEDVMLLLIDTATMKNFEHVSNWGQTILHHLALYEDAPAAAAAMRRVFQRTTTRHVNKRDAVGQTPLHWCLRWNLSYDIHRETALCLMTHGASGTIMDKEGKTPLDYYDDNECKGYEDATRQKQKKELRDLLEVSTDSPMIIPVHFPPIVIEDDSCSTSTGTSIYHHQPKNSREPKPGYKKRNEEMLSEEHEKQMHVLNTQLSHANEEHNARIKLLENQLQYAEIEHELKVNYLQIKIKSLENKLPEV